MATMIDFTGQVAVVDRCRTRTRPAVRRRPGAARRRRAWSTTSAAPCTATGRDPRVADQVVDEIRLTGGRAVASYDSVDSPAGRSGDRRHGGRGPFGRLDVGRSATRASSTASRSNSSSPELATHAGGAPRRRLLPEPARLPVMTTQNYGRFVFISSSAGIFGQPMEAHYAAAKTGLVGLSNVIAIEGAAHGILSNTVLPTGFSRMVTETVGDEKFLAESGFMRAIQPELVVPLVTFLASRSCTFTHRNYSACAGRFARVFIGLGRGLAGRCRHRPHRRRHRGAPRPRCRPPSRSSCRTRSSTRCSRCATGWGSARCPTTPTSRSRSRRWSTALPGFAGSHRGADAMSARDRKLQTLSSPRAGARLTPAHRCHRRTGGRCDAAHRDPQDRERRHRHDRSAHARCSRSPTPQASSRAASITTSNPKKPSSSS